jgi:uncharacterized protein (DUF1697 family)
MPKYLALLRGINVGGRNLIRMTDLKTCFEQLGCSHVTTYIQSGNVIFKTKKERADVLVKKIETALTRCFGFSIPVVIITHAELRDTVEHAPKGFGTDPTTFRYDVIFVKKPLTTSRAMQSVSTKPDVDVAHVGKHALYFSRLTARATQSRLSKIVQTPIYPNITIRNWNTTTKILALMDAEKP